MEWIITKEHEGMLLGKYLKEVHSFSKRIIVAVKFDGGVISVNGQDKTVRYKLVAGDHLTIQFPPEIKGNHMIPTDIPLDILYEDEDILIINKQPGIAIAPTPQHSTNTVANGVLAHYERHNIPYTVHTVTRLDRDTSGLILIAKHRYSHSLLAITQREGKIKRSYNAIVEGTIAIKQGIINENIGRKEGSIIERTVTKTGKTAITHYKVKQEFKKHSLVSVQLITGRTHQIRVHFSYIGHPLAGDDLYGGSRTKICRQALHCDALSFEHPRTKEIMKFEQPLPMDMINVLD